MRLLFESGAANEVAGSPGARYESSYDAWPIPDTQIHRLWLGPDHKLAPAAPDLDGFDSYADDPLAGEQSYSATDDFDAFIQPTIQYEWTHFPADCVSQYEIVVDETFTIAGQAHVELWLRPGSSDTAVQVTLSEIQPDGQEVRIQTGYHRPIHGVLEDTGNELHLDYTFAGADRSPLTTGEWILTRVPFMPVACVLRKGTRLRLGISTPGRDHPFWRFENPVEPFATHDIGWGANYPSVLVLPVIATPEHPKDFPAAHALRGRVNRTAQPI